MRVEEAHGNCSRSNAGAGYCGGNAATVTVAAHDEDTAAEFLRPSANVRKNTPAGCKKGGLV